MNYVNDVETYAAYPAPYNSVQPVPENRNEKPEQPQKSPVLEDDLYTRYNQNPELTVELYSQQLTKNVFETYMETSQSLQEDEKESSNDVYTFNPQEVNDALEMSQRRNLAVATYEDNQNAAYINQGSSLNTLT